MKFMGLTLDEFQVKAIEAIENNHSVVVSAPTGSGKTLTADYIIDRDLKLKKRVIYTAPIKALSNQKFKDFKEQYGPENIGILTGDVVINPSAPILIMTTEVYRNMILVEDPMIADISYVIFDEIHFISDPERGYVWEESVIFSPEHIRFLCLSATIPNAREFAEWISTIKGHVVEVVHHTKRAVPLHHMVFDKDKGMCELNDIKKLLKFDKYPQYGSFKKGKKGKPQLTAPDHRDLIKDLRSKKLLPAIYFAFSRALTQKLADQTGKKFDFLTKEEKTRVIQYCRKAIQDVNLREFATTKILRHLLTRGVAFHHAGVLPQLKDIVEHLFGEGLVKVLYATETFAVGINMPAKVVCFNSLEKYDGISFRYLNSKEYFQLAGRAGRRGIDKEGKAIAMVDRKFVDIPKIKSFTGADKEPLVSFFKLSDNTILNMVEHHAQDQIDVILRSSFDFYLRYGARAFKEKKANPLKGVFTKKKNKLTKKGFIKDDKLTPKGKFATHIFRDEVLIAEIFFENFADKFNTYQIMLILATICYEPKRANRFDKVKIGPETKAVIKKIGSNPYFKNKIDVLRMRKVAGIVSLWHDQGDFIELMEMCNLQEGDLIRLFRQLMDLLTQIRKASHKFELNQKLDDAFHRINRDFVRVGF
ncbi:MAG: DEAD/DEAH box helicase [Candidatus Nanoarchaeia archaeon]